MAGLGMAFNEVKVPGFIDIDPAEQVEGHQQVRQAQPPFAQFHQQVVSAVAKEPVAQFLIAALAVFFGNFFGAEHTRSEEHTSELQSLMRISYAVFCLKKKKKY